MDRLVKVDSLDLSLYFTPNHRSSTTFHLTNLMHTMSVAVSLTTTTNTTSIFTLSQPYTVLPPLSTTLFTLSLTHPFPSPPPISTSLLVRTSILPTGKAHQDDLRRLFSKPGSHIFKDATLPISFVGHHVVHHLLSSPLPSNSLELSFSLTKAISACSPEQLTELLHLAVKNSQKTNSVSALIEAGADVNSRDADGRSVLYFPIRSGDFELVRILIESGCVIDGSKDLFLHFAAEMDRLDLMEVLLNHSVNSIALVQNLVTNSINLDQSPFSSKKSAKSVDGSPFLSKKSISPFLLKRSDNSVDGSPPFMSKGSVNSVGQTEAQLRNSVSLVKSVDSVGRTPLHVSAFHGHIEAMKLCVSMGGDPDCVDFDGWTPLHCAAAKGHVECVEYLLECCSYSKYSINKDRRTPFMLAVDNGHSGLMDLLHLGDALNRSARVDDVNGLKNCIEEGVNVNLKDQNGWTPLHRAAFKGRIECVKILLSQGAKIDVVDDVGYTPLHCAIEAGKVEVALCLIAHGARANSKSLKGLCSLNLESFKNHPAFVSPMRSGKELA